MYEETFASGFVSARLKEWGIPHETGIAGTGVVATISGDSSSNGPILAFRADMDALDLTEETDLPWKSQNSGKMHGCGHDGHTATVLALGNYLHQTRRFAGTIRLVFQPAEEGGRGAYRMVEDGLLERFPFDEIYGFHNWPYNPIGEFAVTPGYVLAAADLFTIQLRGLGGHAAFPHVCNDLILAGSQLISALQGLVSRETNPLSSAVISVTNFQAGTGAFNVLPSHVELSGTVRTFEPALRERLQKRIREVVESVATMHGLQQELTYEQNTDAVFNHMPNVDYASNAVKAVHGDVALKTQHPVMGSEDFGHFLEHRPGCFVFVGQGVNDANSPHSQSLHTGKYDFNDDIIPLVVEYFAEIAESRMPRSDSAA